MSKQSDFEIVGERGKEKLNISKITYETLKNESTINCHDCYGAYLIACGTGEYVINFSQRIKPGTLFFSFKDVPFSVNTSDNLEYFSVNFKGRRGDELLERFSVSEENCVFHGFENLIPVWKEGLLRSTEETNDLLMESVLLYTFSKLYSASNVTLDTFSEVLSYIDENYSDPHISLNSVAERFFYNAKYFSHVFKKRTGISFSKYLKNIRLKNAFILIDQGVTSVKNISLLTGYADSLYFSKLFKEEVGVSPKTYINQKHANE